jgi:acyl carrier protein
MDKLKEILAGVFQMSAENIVDDLAMDRVDKWDSLTHMKLIVALEETYKIELTAEQIMSMTNVKTIKKIIYRKAAA